MNDSDSLVPLQQLRTVQIIAAALLLGLLSLCGVAVGMVHLGNNGRGVVLPQQIPFEAGASFQAKSKRSRVKLRSNNVRNSGSKV